MKVKLHYYISNQGDGSACLRLCKTAEEAERLDETAQQDDGWGEPSNDCVELTVKDGKVFYEDMVWDEKKKRYNYKLVELKP